ncbi:hypothetical protein A5819_003470 [Enterococcus sp. 7E2_DIV0204]|uniref:hypothetical protein n=1 Tax=unclassified Enterococcus TaxID=2608891 RepID=UPI000A33BAC7|nr:MULTISPECIES: hypothetical protein [unclassified Enterococcus]OTN83701.1 hypothetical protein A5819_003798 [Enterococcus sp. 7E2_DIV0204]OTN86292.1 hypothetical protein A5819_003126 [Enterococcus sp. 7E2_DIV0204]OTN86620.1 hypothetical protein A5819_003470 [Enterococcus sp. 7E2_DIV0204]OTP47591.1 hypothetical protein A5884_003346 [Enterococcus sp. 7D2_DIV0200]OTP48515.1 hypothetical protein A5884_003178 [Enterococcus sp. 7D2_DIV0200]
MSKAKKYRDDEYYTTKEAAMKFFDLVVVPSGILKHKTIVMPFSSEESELYIVAKEYHQNVVPFTGDTDLWQQIDKYNDVAVVDNPPFSLSVLIEKEYIESNIPFILFRSAVTYPIFLFQSENAGIIYHNGEDEIQFEWGFAKYIIGDKYIAEQYPNLLDNLKHHGILQKKVPVGFSFFKTDYDFKINTITFNKLKYPNKKDKYMFMTQGVYDDKTKLEIKDDGRVHCTSY